MTPPTASPPAAADDEPPSLSPSRPLDGDEPPSGVAEQLTYLCEHARQSRAEQIRHGAELRGLRGVVGTLVTELQRLGLVTSAAKERLDAHDSQIASLTIEGAKTAARVQVESVERRRQDSSHDVQLAALQQQQPSGFTATTATRMGAPLMGFGAVEVIGQVFGTSPAATLLALGQKYPQAGYVAIGIWLFGWALSYVRGELSPAQVTALEQRAPFVLRTLDFCHRWAPTMGQAAQGLAPEKAARAAPVIRSIEENRRDS